MQVVEETLKANAALARDCVELAETEMKTMKGLVCAFSGRPVSLDPLAEFKQMNSYLQAFQLAIQNSLTTRQMVLTNYLERMTSFLR